MGTYEDMETSDAGAAPVECFHFRWSDGREWWLTSADHEVTLPEIGTFSPTVLLRGRQAFSQEDAGGEITVTLPRTHAIVEDLILYPPTGTLEVKVYRAHAGDLSASRLLFSGVYRSLELRGPEAILTCASPLGVLSRHIPSAIYQAQCNWVLYSTRCGVDPAPHTVHGLVAEIEHARMVPEVAVCPDAWFAAGWVEGGDGDRRFVVSHAGEWLTLAWPFRGLAVDEPVAIVPGCSRWESDCREKFHNIERFLGFPVIPWRNPHTGRFA